MAKQTCFLMFMVLFSFAFVAHSDDCLHTLYLKTNNVNSGGTNAKVNLKLYDRLGYGVEIQDLAYFGVMGKGHVYFQPGNLDMFAIKAPCFPSKLNVCKMELSHDNSGAHPEWYVDFLEVNTAAPQLLCSHQNFGIQQWLADKPPLTLSVVRDACPAAVSSKVSKGYFGEESLIKLIQA